MSLVLFAWATQDAMFKDITNVNTRKAILDQRLKELDEHMLPVGFYSDGIEEDEVLSIF